METRVYDLDQRTYVPLIPDMAYPMEDDRFSVYARIISTQTNSVGLYAVARVAGDEKKLYLLSHMNQNYHAMENLFLYVWLFHLSKKHDAPAKSYQLITEQNLFFDNKIVKSA